MKFNGTADLDLVDLTTALGHDNPVKVTLTAPATVWQFVLGILSTIPDPSEIVVNELVGPIAEALIKADQEPAAKEK